MSDKKIDFNTENDEDFEILTDELLPNSIILDHGKDEKKRRNDLAFDLATDSIIHEQMLSAQEKRNQTLIQLKQEKERLMQRGKDLKNQALIDQEQDEESLRQFEEYVAQWEKEKEMIFGEKESQKRKSEKDEKIQKYSQMRLKQIQNKVAQNENQKFLGENQMAQEQLEWKMEIDKGKVEKIRLEDPQIAMLRKRFQDAVVQARKEAEKKMSQKEESQKRLDFFEEIMMAQKQKENEKKIQEENEKEKKMTQEENEKEMEILWDQFEWRMTKWKKEDKKIIFGEEMQKDEKKKEIQEENVVIEVEESDKNKDEESLEDYNEKSDNEIRLERFLEVQSNSFDDSKFSDFRIICGEKQFKVHKVILSLHSDLLFNHDQKSSSITLKDLDVNLVEKMLKFMYSGKVEGLEKNAHDLFLLAKKFGVKELEKLCLETINKKITPSNVLNCLLLAFRFDLKELKQNAIFYVCANIQEVQKNKEWEEFVKENGEIVAAILKSVSERRDFTVGQRVLNHPTVPMPQNQGPVISMSTNHCPLVPMPPVFVSQNEPSQKPRRQTKLQALSKQVEKSQGVQPLTSIPLLHNPSLFLPLPPVPMFQNQGPPVLKMPPCFNSSGSEIKDQIPLPKSQGTSASPQDAENLKTLQAMARAPVISMPKSQGTSASPQDAENLKHFQAMARAAENAHRVFEAAELYRESCLSPQISAPLIPLPNPTMYPVSQEKYQDKNMPKMPENEEN